MCFAISLYNRNAFQSINALNYQILLNSLTFLPCHGCTTPFSFIEITFIIFQHMVLIEKGLFPCAHNMIDECFRNLTIHKFKSSTKCNKKEYVLNLSLTFSAMHCLFCLHIFTLNSKHYSNHKTIKTNCRDRIIDIELRIARAWFSLNKLNYPRARCM